MIDTTVKNIGNFKNEPWKIVANRNDQVAQSEYSEASAEHSRKILADHNERNGHDERYRIEYLENFGS